MQIGYAKRRMEDKMDILNKAKTGKKERPIKVVQFGADMKVELVNDGPVTIWIDSQNKE